MESEDVYGEVKKWLKGVLKDPVVSILLKYSSLTRTQFESILIDFAAENLGINKIRFEDKAKMRIKEVSRGAFNRSLRQARKNIISSIYTILLLSYIGLFKGPPFEDYELLAKKLQEYAELQKTYAERGEENLKVLLKIERELYNGIEKMARPKRLKPM